MTNWRSWVKRKNEPNRAKNTRAMEPLAALKRGSRKKATSSMGSSTRRSHTAKAASSTAARAKVPKVTGSVQPCWGPSMMAHSSAPIPAIDSPAPTMSSRGAAGSRDSGSRSRPETSASATIGRLIKNTEPHQKWPSR